MTKGGAPQEYIPVSDVQPDTGLQTAIISGFATSEHMNTSTQLAWTCPTGNCTWPIYASLAVCSQCYDVSHFLTSRSISNSTPLAQKDLPEHVSVSFEHPRKVTQWTLPYANLTIDNWEGSRNATELLGPTDYMVAKSEMYSNNTASFKGYESLLISFSTIKADAGYMSNLTMWQNDRPSAMECGLFLCLQAYKTTDESGQFVETVVETTRRKSPQSWQYSRDPIFANLDNLADPISLD